MPMILELDDEAPAMVSNVLTLAVRRPKREECDSTKHDSQFSDWKVLVDPCDWKNYSVGKDGAERYRVHNLPKDEGPGVYELGVAAPRIGSGRGIVPVYVGEADNARKRLRQYGLTGAHLGRSCSGSPGELIICKGPGLVQEMLARGYPIVYRWTPTRTKREAEKRESKLLDAYDYAWNKRTNGGRRLDDVLEKLKNISSKPTYRLTNNVPRVIPFRQKQVSIRINPRNLVSTEDKCRDYGDREISWNLIPSVIKISTSQPRRVLDGSTWGNSQSTIICGVVVGDGCICRKAPVEGRKRCVEHKGMRISESATIQDITEMRGVAADDGSTCRRLPVPGRKRCDDEQKGMRRITGPIIASNIDSKCGSPLSNKCKSVRENTEISEICGVVGGNGTTCTRPPVQGRKRCDEHKGMRITGSIAASSTSLFPKCSSLSNKEFIWKNPTEICGVVGENGTTCTRPPVQGRKRCDVHKGMRVTGSTASYVDSEYSLPRRLSSRQFISYNSCSSWENTGTCGVLTTKGYPCRNHPVQGRKRCAVHYGRRI